MSGTKTFTNMNFSAFHVIIFRLFLPLVIFQILCSSPCLAHRSSRDLWFLLFAPPSKAQIAKIGLIWKHPPSVIEVKIERIRSEDAPDGSRLTIVELSRYNLNPKEDATSLVELKHPDGLSYQKISNLNKGETRYLICGPENLGDPHIKTNAGVGIYSMRGPTEE